MRMHIWDTSVYDLYVIANYTRLYGARNDNYAVSVHVQTEFIRVNLGIKGNYVE